MSEDRIRGYFEGVFGREPNEGEDALGTLVTYFNGLKASEETKDARIEELERRDTISRDICVGIHRLANLVDRFQSSEYLIERGLKRGNAEKATEHEKAFHFPDVTAVGQADPYYNPESSVHE